MSNKDIEEDIKICKEIIRTNMFNRHTDAQAIENILEDRERYKKLYERALSDLVVADAKANKYDRLVEKIKDKIKSYSKNCTVINSFIAEVLEELLEGK